MWVCYNWCTHLFISSSFLFPIPAYYAAPTRFIVFMKASNSLPFWYTRGIFFRFRSKFQLYSFFQRECYIRRMAFMNFNLSEQTCGTSTIWKSVGSAASARVKMACFYDRKQVVQSYRWAEFEDFYRKSPSFNGCLGFLLHKILIEHNSCHNLMG